MWELTPEEIAFPTLLPAVAVEYPPVSSDVPTTVGFTWANHFYGDRGGSYAGPVMPVSISRPPAFGPIAEQYAQPRRTTADYQARPYAAFYPPVAENAESAMMPPFTTERVQPFYEDRPNRSVDGLGEGDLGPEWYETPLGALGLGAGVGAISYFLTRKFLRRKAR